jgi:hypothetical protein
MWFHYGYFVVLSNGIAVPSGDDFDQTPDTYKIGGSMGVKNGKEGIIVEVVKGDAAKRTGFDVMVFIVENEPRAMVPWVPSREGRPSLDGSTYAACHNPRRRERQANGGDLEPALYSPSNGNVPRVPD